MAGDLPRPQRCSYSILRGRCRLATFLFRSVNPAIPMHTFVINLDRATARRDCMIGELRARGIDFERVSARDWRQLTPEDYALVDREFRSRDGRRALLAGSVACWLSHRDVFRRIADSDHDMTLVLEDDVALSDDAAAVLRQVGESGIPFDILFLNRNRTYLRFWPLHPLPGTESTLGLVRYSDWGSCSYVITRQAARRFLETHPRIRNRIDHTLQAYWDNRLTTYWLDPPIAFHRPPPAEPTDVSNTPRPKRRRTLLSSIHRLQAHLREHSTRRRSFRQRLRDGK